MRVTAVEIMGLERRSSRLLAYCKLELDGCFVIECKIVQGNGRLILAMPSRKATDACTCGQHNPLDAGFCSSCGAKLEGEMPEKLHCDVAFPINRETRENFEACAMKVWEAEKATPDGTWVRCLLSEDGSITDRSTYRRQAQ